MKKISIMYNKTGAEVWKNEENVKSSESEKSISIPAFIGLQIAVFTCKMKAVQGALETAHNCGEKRIVSPWVVMCFFIYLRTA